MDEHDMRPAFYAARGRGWRDWWTVLHPPYTAWHLSYVVFGAVLAPNPEPKKLLATLIAFLLAVGVGAHALDELKGRPLGTSISGRSLWAAAFVSIGGAVGIGMLGLVHIGMALAPFILVGVLLVFGYNLEWFGGILHNDVGFAAAWGSFPLLTSYFAQSRGVSFAAIAAAFAAYGLSKAQRLLSTPARRIRRQVISLDGVARMEEGGTEQLSKAAILGPLDGTLKTLSWSLTVLAAAFAVARFVNY